MLDDEPSTTTDTPAGEAPKKAVRRRRATSSTSAPAAGPAAAAPAEPAEPAEPAQPDGPAEAPAADAAAAPAKRTRKAPAKKAEGAAAPRTRTRGGRAASATEAVAAVVAGDLPEDADPGSPAPTAAPVAADLPVAAALDALSPADVLAPADVPAAGDALDATAGADTSAALDAPAARAPRTRRSSRAARPAGDPAVPVEDDLAVAQAASADTAVAATALGGDDSPTPVTDGADGTEAAPRTRRRRAASPPVVTFQAPQDEEPEPPAARPARRSAPVVDPADDVADDATEQPAADGPAPRRRRRAGTAGAVSPSALVPTLLEPTAPAPGDDDVDEDEEATEDAIVPDDAEARAPGDDDDEDRPRRRRRGRRGRGRRPEGEDDGEDGTPSADRGAGEPAEDGGTEPTAAEGDEPAEDDDDDSPTGTRRRRRRRRSAGSGAAEGDEDGVPTVVHVREPRAAGGSGRARTGATSADEDGVRGITGSTRMAAKRVRRQEGRDSGRKRAPILSEAEFLARREAVDRVMVVRQTGERTQIAVLEDGVLVEHYVTKASAQSYAGNVYLGRVQNVLPSMEAAFVDIGKGRNGVLYAGEVNWEGGGSRKIEQVLKGGQEVLVQVSKDPIGHKGARLTGQISLPGRYLVYVPQGSMTGISRKLPETERARLKAILKKVVPEDAGVIIRTAAEGASEEEISADVRRLQAQWEVISSKASGDAPKMLHTEPDLVIRVVRDVFNEDFTSLVVQGDSEWETIRDYVEFVAPDLAPRLSRHTAETDVFAQHRVDEQLAKGLDRKVWLPSGGSLVIDRTEAMVVIDVNTGKYVGKGGNLEETVTRNNLEAAEEIARQLRLRDLGGIIVVDFIDMVLESNRELVVRRLVECMGRDRTKHQVAEVTSLGLVQMTRKRVGQGLLESFSETCEACHGRGVLVSTSPVDASPSSDRFDDRPRADRKPRVTPPDAPRPRSAPVVDGPVLDAPVLDPLAPDAPLVPDADAPDADVSVPAGRRRRRGGRGGGAAAAAAESEQQVEVEVVPDELDQPVVRQVATPDTDSEPAVDAEPETEAEPDALVDLADQPTSAEEDQPVVPSMTHVEDDDRFADPYAEDPTPAAAAPRRRRRATSRPAGPPAA